MLRPNLGVTAVQIVPGQGQMATRVSKMRTGGRELPGISVHGEGANVINRRNMRRKMKVSWTTNNDGEVRCSLSPRQALRYAQSYRVSNFKAVDPDGQEYDYPQLQVAIYNYDNALAVMRVFRKIGVVS